MHLLLSAAISIDGFLDHSGPQRLVLSSPQDLAAIDEIRASQDAILVGAGTVRRDNPSLCIKSKELLELRRRRGLPPQPAKVTVTRSGSLDPSARFFTTGEGDKILLCPIEKESEITSRFPMAKIIGLEDFAPASISRKLEAAGLNKVMIEGGQAVLTCFLRHRHFSEFRLAIAPLMLGRLGSAKLVSDGQELLDLQLASIERFGETAVLWLAPKN